MEIDDLVEATDFSDDRHFFSEIPSIQIVEDFENQQGYLVIIDMESQENVFLEEEDEEIGFF
jgi:hypothetical protein